MHRVKRIFGPYRRNHQGLASQRPASCVHKALFHSSGGPALIRHRRSRSSRDEATTRRNILCGSRTIRTRTQYRRQDGEIATNLLIVEHTQLLGGLAHLCDCNRVEIGEKSFARAAGTAGFDDPLQARDRVCAEIFRDRPVLSDIARRTISPTVMRSRSRAS